MNELQNFTNGIFNLDVKVDGQNILFSAEQAAKAMGITQVKNGKEYVKWERVNSYLPNSPEVGKGSFISEPMVYKLAFKANNAVSEKFTDWLAVEVLPTIRKNGAYMTNEVYVDWRDLPIWLVVVMCLITSLITSGLITLLMVRLLQR